MDRGAWRAAVHGAAKELDKIYDKAAIYIIYIYIYIYTHTAHNSIDKKIWDMSHGSGIRHSRKSRFILNIHLLIISIHLDVI